MGILKSLALAFSLFSVLPAPSAPWTRETLRAVLPAFPLVGAVCGLLWTALALLPLPALLRGAALCLAPLVFTGGIHLDGYADTWDARASWGGQEKKQEILHDPHCGAFALIHLGIFFVASFAFSASLLPTPRALFCLGLSFPLSRSLSGWSLTAWPLARDTGLAHTLVEATSRRGAGLFLGVLAALLLLAQILAGGPGGLAMAAAAAITLVRYRRLACREFGGVSGDLAGWFLQTCELWQLGALVLTQTTEALT